MTKAGFDALRPGDVVKLDDDSFWTSSVRSTEAVIGMDEYGRRCITFKGEIGRERLDLYPHSKNGTCS
jgi:hypothetical protein